MINQTNTVLLSKENFDETVKLLAIEDLEKSDIGLPYDSTLLGQFEFEDGSLANVWLCSSDTNYYVNVEIGTEDVETTLWDEVLCDFGTEFNVYNYHFEFTIFD